MGIYADWPDLVAHYTREAEGIRERVAAGSEGLADASGFGFVSAFIGLDQQLALLLAVLGPDAIRGETKAYHPHLVRAAASLGEVGLSDHQTAQSIANVALMAECLGLPRLQGLTSALLTPLLAVREDFDDPTKRSLAFTALALRDPETARTFLDAPVAAFDLPVARFEFNIYGVIGYLATAIEQRRPAAWVEALWIEYIELFTWHLAADAAEWADLFCFARVVADLRGEDAATVAEEVHERVMRLGGPS